MPETATGRQSPPPHHLLAVDIGGTSTRVALADGPGGKLKRRKFDTPEDIAPDALADRIVAVANSLMTRENIVVGAAGVSVAGAVDVRTGTVVESPNLPSFRRTPLRHMLAERLNVPVVIENDANATALAENRIGVGRGSRHMVYLTVSTGIGAGIIVDGRLYRGAAGGAGEFGHMTVLADGPDCRCGRKGCWEMLASGTAIARQAQERLRDGERSLLIAMSNGDVAGVSAKDVFDAARRMDPLSRDVLERATFYLGEGLANVLNILNPEVVVIGGGLAREPEMLIEPAVRLARERAFDLHVETADFRLTRMGDDNGLRGALLLAEELAQGR